ncbi:MAG: formylglycine-generating enzyme family protein [Aulosira sp. ZfuVER01]|nr:formylglycine-generating enzyme family protein [Aulosira sp. ZfuVER01]MDZ8000532.1 formylglycine-generating enzyme family protein [Aulosira sp. DedVER01a]MDZ8056333.1 formylglycine-generating enzyme family protein [Aulosira sp. ZfuCHP01]
MKPHLCKNNPAKRLVSESEKSKFPGHVGRAPHKGMVWIPGGSFLMGSDHHYPEENPSRQVKIDGFWIDQSPVTNRQFQRFVKETGYITMAERSPKLEDYPDALPELLVPGSLVFQQPHFRVELNSANWWAYVPGANWRHPEGPGSSIKGKENHPVVHVTVEDAEAYSVWAGKTLPTEAQWEFAARGGLVEKPYAWGDELVPEGKVMANFWLGEFPWQNLKNHRPGTTSVASYPANGYGLYDMIGNVWEWTADWYQDYQLVKPKSCCVLVNPRGCTREESIDSRTPEVQIPRKVVKGGSFLCAANYCRRYRPAARHPEMIDTSTCHIGFRCVVNI